MPSDSTLTLFIPDLFGFQSILPQLSQEEKSQLPFTRFPVLEKWLSRGLSEKKSAGNDILTSEFGLLIEENKDIPYAALSLLAEKKSETKDLNLYWLRADPVCLHADRDTVLLSAHEEISLTQQEADTLVEKINAHFINEPWTLYCYAPHRWYLGLEKPANLNTQPVTNVLGKNVDHHMSTGDDANYWLGISNEIQMLLHSTNVNFERESRNMLTANSLWIWGGGYLPQGKDVKVSYEKILTNDMIFSGVGLHCDLDVLPLDEGFLKHVEKGNNFIVLDMLSALVKSRDLYSFMQALHEIETTFLNPCNELLKSGKIKKLKLIVDNNSEITITQKRLNRWWKRIKSFTDFKYE